MDPSLIGTDQTTSSIATAIAGFLTEAAGGSFENRSTDNPFDVKTVFPQWLVDDHDSNNTNFIKFFQYYYDWLYSSDISGLYTENIESLQDIDNIIPITKNAFRKSFIPQLDGVTLDEPQKLLRNFKRDIIEKKGTAEGIALFFTKIFPEIRSVNVEGSGYTQDITLIGESVQSEIVYEDAYNKYMKPVGFTVNIITPASAQGSQSQQASEDIEIEQRLAEFGFDTALSRGISFENPIIGNYLVYNQGDTGTIGYTSGCSGSSHPRGISANTADMPTYTHPNGVVSSVGASFGSINIYEFLYMPYDSSPNHGITGC